MIQVYKISGGPKIRSPSGPCRTSPNALIGQPDQTRITNLVDQDEPERFSDILLH